MDTFLACSQVNDLIEKNQEEEARNGLIKILDYYERENKEYEPVLNHLIRLVGLYPYLRTETSSWEDRFAYEAFKVDAGKTIPITLHREQSLILKKLLEGESLAISAPTSFGKSFIIDSFIAINKPKNIVIIVPTIALTDETRRRLHQKFSDEYQVITTSEIKLKDKNIFIFPQERAINYVDKIDQLDILVIDEFYKASPKFDKERSPSLLRAILELGNKASQKYFLAPNISRVNDNPFTRGMEFIQINFNTVYLDKYNLYDEINNDELKKSEALLTILKETTGKTLIYAGTYTNIDVVSHLIIDSFESVESKLLRDFSNWLAINYAKSWSLTSLIKRGSGIHNGQLHRSLSQIQVKLFEEKSGLKNIISTSSIIEGVNTSAENVVIWRNRNGASKLNDFTYKNIIGRGGRMFKHFIGKIYILEPPPDASETELDLEFPDELVGSIDENDFKKELSNEQIAKIISYREELSLILGEDTFRDLQTEKVLSSDSSLIMKIAKDVTEKSEEWNGLGYLNSTDVDNWDRLLYKIINIQPGGWGIKYSHFVKFIKILSKNWPSTIPELLSELDEIDIGINDFFKLERTVTYKFSSLVNDINLIQKKVYGEDNIDLSTFISKLSNAFLPPVVYLLEEYGLPRMISKKIHESGIIDFENEDLDLNQCLNELKEIGLEGLRYSIDDLESFDLYILDYFFEGITFNKEI